jgi:DNA-binding NarL/FixJ family response regulator
VRYTVDVKQREKASETMTLTTGDSHRQNSGHCPSKIKILIVDDKEQVRRDLRMALELMEGLEVVGEAADGLEAVHQAEMLSPDLVLMDLEMPRMDGFEATRQIKDRCLARGVVALTVYGDDSARLRADRAGADAFVEKGTSLQTLSEIIWQVWGEISSPGSD